MTQEEINNSIKKVWTDKLKQKKESLTTSIINGYTAWVRNLVKQAAEQQTQQKQSAQPAQQPGQQGENNLPQGGVA